MLLLEWFLALAAVDVLAGLLATGGELRRASAIALAVGAACAIPSLVPAEHYTVRAIMAVACIATMIRTSDLAYRVEPTSPERRIAHVLSIPDSFRVRAVTRELDGKLAVRAVLFALVGLVGRSLAFDVAPHIEATAARLPVRWLGGLLYIYGLSDAAYAALTVAYRLVGRAAPIIHRDPALARSVREFWGRRWNRIVGAWLDARFYRPLARRGRPLLGVALAFAVSAVLHGYVTYPALGMEWAVIVTGYFLLQGMLAWIEGPLRVARWSPRAGHVWAIVVLGGTSPLICEPFLRVVAP